MKKFKPLEFVASLLFLISIILDIIELFNEKLIVLNYISLALLIAALVLFIIIFLKEKANKRQ